MVTKSSGVGRPRAFDPVEVADRALEVFWNKGYAGATTRVLEAELDLTQSSIYNTFGSKSGLMDAALERYEERFARDVLAPLDAAGLRGFAAVDALLDSIVAWVGQPPRQGCLMVNGLVDAGSDERVQARVQGFMDRLRTLLVSHFTAAGLSADMADGHSRTVIAGIIGLCTLARGGVAPELIVQTAASIRSTLAPVIDLTDG